MADGRVVSDRAWTLPAAVGLAAIETTALIAVVLFRGQPSAPYVIALLATKYPFSWLALQRRHGAFLGLCCWELAGLLAALLAHNVPGALRLLETALALGVSSLLVASAHLFPPAELPRR